MKKFVFSLERLMRLAQMREEVARAQLLTQENIVRLAEVQVKTRSHSLSAMSFNASSKEELQGTFALQLNGVEALEFSEREKSIALDQRDSAKGKWTVEKRSFESLSRLEERDYRSYIEELTRFEQMENDEVGSVMWYMRKREDEQ
ncbi:hypothetical protein [Acidithrix ferrooxidans]|uniref:Flagellar FliJ protein n=1 Tax=Acidithrix ferrooxidans TaxID=1280514 RepID=A0A0D8HHK5_9ACTN|nr:hypothetical protein [Acidithrix ferrooxidans]KJF16561.1 hypothetical protein AXFE_26240 [Acidithrix ferrooxidans]